MTQDAYEVTILSDAPDQEKNGQNNTRGENSRMVDANNKPEEGAPFIEKEVETGTEDEIYHHGRCSRWVERVEKATTLFWKKHGDFFSLVIKIALLLLYLTYFGYCCYVRYFDEGSYILTAITVGIFIKIGADNFCGPKYKACLEKGFLWYGTSRIAKLFRKFSRYGMYIIAMVLLWVYLGVEVFTYSPRNIQAILGIIFMILVCFITSARPSKVNWHPVFWGFAIQFGFATLTLRTEIGYGIFKWMGDLVNSFVSMSDKGANFVLGESYLHDNAGLFFESAGVIVFFNSVIFMLDYYGILEFIVLKIGSALALCLETGPVESVVAAANIFIGLSEAPLLVRPYLPTVTKSELHSIMTCGFASISGAFMAMFIKAGAPASHLLTAAIISAPAALALTKLMYPETEKIDYEGQKNIKMKQEGLQRNGLQAASDGAAFSIKLVASIMVNMMAFVSLLNLVNHLFVWVGERAGIENMTFDYVCSYVLYPLSYVMGAPTEDCGKLGALMGVRMLATPFVAYKDLGAMIRNRVAFEKYVSTTNGTWHWAGNDVILDHTNTTLLNGFMTERSEVIATYALCGLSAFPAIGFTMGTLVPMCPPRKPEVVELILRAFIAGNLANIVTGAVAGVMFTGQS